MNQALAEVLRYNRWATLRLLDACRELPDEQLDARAPGTSGTVRERRKSTAYAPAGQTSELRRWIPALLLHVVGGQQTFVLRTRGRQHEGEMNRSSTWPGFDALRAVAVETSDQLVAIAEGLDDDRPVDLPYFGSVYRYPTSFFLAHAVEHGVEHRTEIKLTLAQLGVETPDLDGWAYCGDAGHGRRVGPTR